MFRTWEGETKIVHRVDVALDHGKIWPQQSLCVQPQRIETVYVLTEKLLEEAKVKDAG